MQLVSQPLRVALRPFARLPYKYGGHWCAGVGGKGLAGGFKVHPPTSPQLLEPAMHKLEEVK